MPSFRTRELTVDVRDATPADLPLLSSLIREMAAFEELTATATEETLGEALFGEEPAARALLAFVDGEPAGYATWFFSFSSMLGRRALWMDDLFVTSAFRGKGLGKVLLACVARIAVEKRCARFEWIVLDWNTDAIRFYEGLGAELLPEWRICRVDEARTRRIADTLQGAS